MWAHTDSSTAQSEPAPALGPLRALARLSTLRAVNLRHLAVGDLWIALPGIVAIALFLAVDRWSAGAQAEWYGSGFAGMAWYALGVMAVAWLVSRTAFPRLPYRSVLFALAALAPLAVGAQVVLETWLSEQAVTWGWIALFVAGCVYLWRVLRASYVYRAAGVTLLAAIAVLALISLTNYAYISAQVWYATDNPGDSSDPTWEYGERLLFDQPERIDAELARLAPRDPDRGNVFFVGFAGYAAERVFANEIRFAAKVVGDRYGSTERSVLLLNDRRDRDSKPLATVSGLRRALAGVAARMDVNQDVLFLVLSSHGSDDPLLSVENGMLPLEQLTGEALEYALRQSGIRWRVIVISACHAGAFIDSLKDDRTIVLTAAAADRTSFGCSNDRDLTYFGEAFFRDALPGAPTLREAFESARRAIAVREKQEAKRASMPQAHFGSEIVRKWADFERAAAHRSGALSRAPGLTSRTHKP